MEKAHIKSNKKVSFLGVVKTLAVIGFGCIALKCGIRYEKGKTLESEYVEQYGEYYQVVSQNNKVPAGYYNEHPLKICISNEFSKIEQLEIKRALSYFDAIAEGLSFDINVGNVEDTDANIKIYKDMYAYEKFKEGRGAIACSTRNRVDAKKIKGDIHINEDNDIIDVYSIVIHEMGHMIGLEHTSDSDNIMFIRGSHYTILPKLIKAFSKYEVDLINTLYPAEETIHSVDLSN